MKSSGTWTLSQTCFNFIHTASAWDPFPELIDNEVLVGLIDDEKASFSSLHSPHREEVLSPGPKSSHKEGTALLNARHFPSQPEILLLIGHFLSPCFHPAVFFIPLGQNVFCVSRIVASLTAAAQHFAGPWYMANACISHQPAAFWWPRLCVVFCSMLLEPVVDAQ